MDSRVGRTAAKITTAREPTLLTAVLATPTKTAATANSNQPARDVWLGSTDRLRPRRPYEVLTTSTGTWTSRMRV